MARIAFFLVEENLGELGLEGLITKARACLRAL